ncbi:kinetochore protein nuf2 [Gouania willdenowi]|uniref:Kinetochore protein nuf2-like n=1 Tax=Gouania willdenowi TaxID=441366 RepID=A0A8C5DLD9_GOUWI|nr:kinetochore protein nuf2-like [Gouania willdenowi]
MEGINFEGLFNATMEENGDLQVSKVEELVVKLRRLQQGKRVLEEEISVLSSTSDTLQKELETLQADVYHLEGIEKQKQELCRKLQIQCGESEQESVRYLNQNKKSEEMLQHYQCKIQEYKMKHRKLRIRFENQLHQVIEQHKNLHSLFTPERLPEELRRIENTKRQLLSAEQLKLGQLQNLNMELEELKKEKPLKITDEKTQEGQNC